MATREEHQALLAEALKGATIEEVKLVPVNNALWVEFKLSGGNPDGGFFFRAPADFFFVYHKHMPPLVSNDKPPRPWFWPAVIKEE